MPRPSKPARSPATEAPKPTATSHLFQARKLSERGHGLTREHSDEHLEAFRRAGGMIEVLGTTRALTRIGVDATDAPTPQPANPAPRTRSR